MSIKITTRNSYIPHLLEVDRIVQTTRNLFDPNNIMNNKDIRASDGVIIDSNTSVITNLIPVKHEQTITANHVIGRNFLLYNSERLVVEHVKPTNDISVNPYTITNPNVCYVRFCMEKTAVKGLQLELGTEATPYVPHLLEVSSIQQKTEDGIEIAFEEGDS